ncbi:MAG: hypothetical protein A3G39_07780 [Deltaproteobacteria bacterium RIFCSPLOWO2_12_FULL_43_16]|nr:MAG: hypothetical protein A2Z89_05580 [Deltaproteobacteria bacterium GWA2_43_19]OGQ12113.1 MAG: hypothetical protein A3D30_07185 [Deltaproteobacteria bacterium RIFCSPHIGHO2_02_FULL_43_33]OGQ61519.1 MAG: hypothetical protein A3G39_07780 [Deltaproteobacteria bacterium RIFCSPLOWO2_12_FULL_43_16]HBR16139.1 hypothetical protein [Deltaproteobacteria bacterium]
MKSKLILISVVFIIMTALPAIAGGRYGSTWETTISVSYGNDTSLLTLGGDKTATDGFENRWETRALLAGNIKAYFYHPEWGKETPYFWSEIKDLSLPKEWVFYISSTLTNQELMMRWDISSVPQEITSLYLVDEAAAAVIDMKTQAAYAYINTSSSPKTFTVKVNGSFGETPPPAGDIIPPDTSITSAIAEFINATSINIAYAGSDNTTSAELLRFSCKLDNGAWSAWSDVKSVTLNGLSEGSHTFSVKSKDEAGNEDATPAEVKFTVDTAPPALMLNQPEPSILWPANGDMVNVIVSGNVKDISSGLASANYTVSDEYNQLGLAGNIIAGNDGGFLFNISLKAEKDSKDKDGRIYTITINSVDKAGNITTQSVMVIVPHDKK